MEEKPPNQKDKDLSTPTPVQLSENVYFPYEFSFAYQWLYQYFAENWFLLPSYRAAFQNEWIAPCSVEEHQETPRKKCKCTQSRCLKLYCECLAAEIFCQGCYCKNCLNKPETSRERTKAIEAIVNKNPQAFKSFIEEIQVEGEVKKINSKGCRCKKSHCRKKYCECFLVGARCSSYCKCIRCKN